MRIQHNIMALNSYRQLSGNNSALSKNLEKLSSGYAINRAGDDAAGLAISEKMRAQIKGLEAAQKNANDGISLVQTAEGALTEVHSMLNRMVYLATQSANGTYDDTVDRTNLDKEVQTLKEEIDRISKSTNFNGLHLLDGSMDAEQATTTTAASAISNITTSDYAPKGKSDAFSASYITNRPEAVKTQTCAEFVVSLDDYSLSGLEAGDKVTLNVGDSSLSYVVQAADVAAGDTMTAADIVAKLVQTGYAKPAAVTADTATGDTTGFTADKYTGVTDASPTTQALAAANNYIKIGENIWKMEATNTNGAGANNAIKFTQVDFMGTSGTHLNPEFTVGMEVNDAATTKTLTESGTINTQVQSTVKGEGIGTSHQAQATVDIDFSKLKDGDKLIAGDKTYVFKIGKDSTTTAGTGEVEVDLSKIFKEEADMADEQKQMDALNKIVKSMDASTTWTAGDQHVSDGVGTIRFQSLSSYVGDTTPGAGNANVKYIAGNTNNGICDMRTEAEVLKQFYGERPESGATVSFDLDVTKIKAGDTFTIDGKTFEFTDGANASSTKNVAIDLSALGVSGGLLASQTGDVTALVQDAIENTLIYGDDSQKYNVTVDGNKITLATNDDTTTPAFENRTAATIELPTETTYGRSLSFQVGDTADDYQKVELNIKDMSSAGLGIADVKIDKIGDATDAIAKIKDAINAVSSQRGDLGAIQNRLEHTINNLGVQVENITAAESRIRDTDMAQEMMAYTKNNILVQAAQAMLAQANQVPQGILQLLQ